MLVMHICNLVEQDICVDVTVEKTTGEKNQINDAEFNCTYWINDCVYMHNLILVLILFVM